MRDTHVPKVDSQFQGELVSYLLHTWDGYFFSISYVGYSTY